MAVTMSPTVVAVSLTDATIHIIPIIDMFHRVLVLGTEPQGATNVYLDRLPKAVELEKGPIVVTLPGLLARQGDTA
jgi:hypothetical protein